MVLNYILVGCPCVYSKSNTENKQSWTYDAQRTIYDEPIEGVRYCIEYCLECLKALLKQNDFSRRNEGWQMRSFSSDFHDSVSYQVFMSLKMLCPHHAPSEYSDNGNFHIWKTKTNEKSNQSITVKDVTYFHSSFFYLSIYVTRTTIQNI